ncbi:MarR family transcriptional regulator [Candidatus Peregrinibacteria bacterium]|nr:MarR family transcriptional regulator [Candidatus Peregrinibacteria bacterium]
MQVEYATDIVFKHQKDLQPVYSQMCETAIHAVKADDVATFLGRKLKANYNGEAGSNYGIRIEGTRIRHQLGSTSVKMYDKFGHILRIEVTSNDVSFFKQFRDVRKHDGSVVKKYASMKKSIYSMSDLATILKEATTRYIAYISDIEDRSGGIKRLIKIARTIRKPNQSIKGLNLFDESDLSLLNAIARGEFTISGFRNKHLRKILPGISSQKMSRLLLRLRLHGLIKRVPKTLKYYLTTLGRSVVLLGLKLREMVIIPHLAYCK